MQTQYRNLRTFCVTAELLSFKDAAEKLSLTASAISHQIKDLESYYDVQLFVRGTRSIELSVEGKKLHNRIRLHFDAIDQASTELKSGTRTASLQVQMPEFFASEIFLPRIAEFSERYKTIDLHIDMLDSGKSIDPKTDIGIILTSRGSDNQTSKRIFPIHYVPACSPYLYERLTITELDTFAPERILLHKARPLAWEMWAHNAGLSDIPKAQIVLLDSMFALIKAAEEGVGVALIPMPVSRSRFESGKLVPLFDEILKTRDYYTVITQPNIRNQAASHALWQWIIETFSTEPEEYSSVA